MLFWRVFRKNWYGCAQFEKGYLMVKIGNLESHWLNFTEKLVRILSGNWFGKMVMWYFSVQSDRFLWLREFFSFYRAMNCGTVEIWLFFAQDLKQNGNRGKCTDLTEKLTSKIQTGTEKSIFHLFGFFGNLRKMGEKLPQRNFRTQLIWIQSDTVGGGISGWDAA